jgi:hypothetical protein
LGWRSSGPACSGAGGSPPPEQAGGKHCLDPVEGNADNSVLISCLISYVL